jgi:Leucine-rich repeat (LRR) protein
VEELEALVLTVAPNSQDRLSNVNSAQFRALVWLQERLSGQSFGDVSNERIIQKWAMTTFAFRISWDQQWLGSGNDECTWTGITCNDSGEVTAIVLDNQGIQGDLPAELSLLSQLERLIVSENSFTGDVPGSFGDLKKLQDFRMDRNEFTGELPQSIGGMSSLRIWYMERNVNLGGTFPESVLELQNLQELVFYYTSITGELPAGVCSLGLASLILDCRQVQSDCWTQCFYRCGGETGVACGDGNGGS